MVSHPNVGVCRKLYKAIESASSYNGCEDKSIPTIELSHLTSLLGVEDADKMGHQALPYSQLPFMQEVGNEQRMEVLKHR